MVARQIARLPLGKGGVDRKSHDKHVEPPQYESLVNVEAREEGSWRKRRSLGASPTYTEVGTIVAPECRYRIEDVPARGSQYSLTAAPRDGSTEGDAKETFGLGVSSLALVNGSSANGQETVAGHIAEYGGDLYVLSVNPSGSDYLLRLTRNIISDDGTSAVELYRGFVDNADRPYCRLVSISNGVAAVWTDSSGDIYVAKATATSVGSASTLVASAWSGSGVPGLDVATNDAGDKLYVIVYNSASNDSIIRGWDYNGTTFTLMTNTENVGRDANLNAICAGDTYVIAASLDTGTGSPAGTCLRTAIDLDNTETQTFTVTVPTGTPSVNYSASLGFLNTENEAVLVWSQSSASSPYYPITAAAYLDIDGLAEFYTADEQTNTLLAHGPVPTHGIFGVYAGDAEDGAYIEYNRPVGSSVPRACGVFAPGGLAEDRSAADVYNNIGRPVVVATDTGFRYHWAAVVRTQVRLSEFGGVVAQTSLAIATMDRSAGLMGNHAVGHGSMLLAGSAPTPVVSGLPLAWSPVRPEVYSAAAFGGGSLTASSTYNVRLVYEWTDARGRTWESRPSAVTTVNLGVGETLIELEVFPPPLDMVLGGTLAIVPYCTTAGGSIYYRSRTFDQETLDRGTLYNGTVTVQVSDGDSTLETRQVLYTDGGELEHSCIPPMSTVVSHKQRLVGVNSETGDIWPSLEIQDGVGVHFSSELVIKNPIPGRRPTALVSTDAALVVFYRDRIGFIYGEGPNNQGVGQPFSTIQFLPDADVGAISQKSVQKVPMGIFFCDADKGFHVMAYGGGPPQYIGRDLDGAPSGTIIGTAHLPDRHEVRTVFYDAETYALSLTMPDSGDTTVSASWLTWHYDRGAWSFGVAADHAAGNTSCAADGNTFIINGVAESDSRGYDDTSTYVPMHMVTGWLPLRDMTRKQGQHRIWDMWLLAEAEDECDLGIRLAYNYDGTNVSDHGATSYTDDKWRVRPGKQLVEAVKVAIEDTEGSGTTTAEGVTISDIEIHYGVYPGAKPRRAPSLAG